MAYLPGLFASVTLASPPPGAIVNPPNISTINRAIVLHKSDNPAPDRFTEWVINADSTLVYQTGGALPKFYIGDAGNIYQLSESVLTDAGAAIPLTIITQALPKISEDYTITTQKRVLEAVWTMATQPPTAGYSVTFTATDVDDPTNVVTKTVAYNTRKVRIPIGLKARQWQFSWVVSVSQDFNILSWGYSFQVTHRPYAYKKEIA